MANKESQLGGYIISNNYVLLNGFLVMMAFPKVSQVQYSKVICHSHLWELSGTMSFALDNTGVSPNRLNEKENF